MRSLWGCEPNASAKLSLGSVHWGCGVWDIAKQRKNVRVRGQCRFNKIRWLDCVRSELTSERWSNLSGTHDDLKSHVTLVNGSNLQAGFYRRWFECQVWKTMSHHLNKLNKILFFFFFIYLFIILSLARRPHPTWPNWSVSLVVLPAAALEVLATDSVRPLWPRIAYP